MRKIGEGARNMVHHEDDSLLHFAQYVHMVRTGM